jgi:hypothetical protein
MAKTDKNGYDIMCARISNMSPFTCGLLSNVINVSSHALRTASNRVSPYITKTLLNFISPHQRFETAEAPFSFQASILSFVIGTNRVLRRIIENCIPLHPSSTTVGGHPLQPISFRSLFRPQPSLIKYQARNSF